MDNFGYENKRKNTQGKLKIKILFFLILIIIVKILISQNSIDKEYITVSDLGALSEPNQELATGTVVKIIDDKEVTLNYVASYKISGRVVKTYSYPQVGIENKLSKKDVALTWGDLAKDENDSKVVWGHNGNRFLKWTIYDNEWYNNFGSANFQEHVANNHLISCDDDINKKINNIKEDEYVMLTGYLVNATYELDNGSNYYWSTSTNRSDSGNGACEIIYVTDVKWLTERTR